MQIQVPLFYSICQDMISFIQSRADPEVGGRMETIWDPRQEPSSVLVLPVAGSPHGCLALGSLIYKITGLNVMILSIHLLAVSNYVFPSMNQSFINWEGFF